MTLARELQEPLRYPDTGSGEFMTKRARWLVVLGFLLPGSAQVLAGNKKLGRIGLAATFLLYTIILLAVLGFFFARTATLTILTNSITLLILQVIVVLYAVLWLVLGFDTLRNTKMVKVLQGWRVPIALLSIVLTVAPAAGALWASNMVGSGRAALSGIFTSAGPSVAPVDGRYNILLLGADAGDGREGLRPDSISLISVNAETGESIIVGLPRELTGMPFPETSPMHELHPSGFGNDWGCDSGVCYLNSLFTEVNVFNPDIYDGLLREDEDPGIRAIKEAVTGATGLETQFFVLVDMEGFSQIIDALGGVRITVEERLPIGGDEFGEGVEGWVEVGEQLMDGFTAQWYARSRYTTDDYDRMMRQRELQRAILAQMTPMNVLQRFNEIAKASQVLVMTDIPESMLGVFVELAAKAKNFDPLSVELTPPTVNPDYPEYDVIHELVQQGVRATTPVPEVSDE